MAHNLLLIHFLPSFYLHRQAVLFGRDHTGIFVIVCAIWIVGFVEVEIDDIAGNRDFAVDVAPTAIGDRKSVV